MILQQMLSRFREKKQKFRDAMEETNIQKTIETRRKSSDERELERFQEEDRQKSIKRQLEQFRTRKNIEDKRTFMFDGGSNLIRGKATVLQNNNKLLQGESMFFNKGSMFLK